MRRLSLLPVVVLCAVGCAQMVLVHSGGLTPWKGGGFGMFSSVASPATRLLRVYVETPAGWVSASLPPSESRAVSNLRALPSLRGLNDLVSRLQGYRWAESATPPSIDVERIPDSGEDTAGPPAARGPVLNPVPPGVARFPRTLRLVQAKSVRAELLQLEFDPAAHTIGLRKLVP